MKRNRRRIIVGREDKSALNTPAIHAVGAVGAQVVRAVYQHDRSVGIGGELSLDKGHVFDKFFAVASADKGLETEKMVGTKMEF